MTWTAPTVDRTDPANDAAERDALEIWLTFQRKTLLAKCAGLDGKQLTTATVEPSNLTLLGLVRHMAEVERWWFRRQFAGQDLGDIFCTPEHFDGDLDLIDAANAEADFATFAEECRLADAAAAGRDLDEGFTSPRGAPMNLRWVYVHMIEEYARHNGHADLIRERLDGVTGS
jgi:uncharacterized damage-inducible protein DinB